MTEHGHEFVMPDKQSGAVLISTKVNAMWMRIQVERTFCNDSELMQDFEQKLPIMCPFSKRVTEYHVLHSPVHRVN